MRICKMCGYPLKDRVCDCGTDNGEPLPVESQSHGSLADMTLEEAEALAKQTDYAFELSDCDGLNPVNWADASAFFLEGYLYAKKQANVSDELRRQA